MRLAVSAIAGFALLILTTPEAPALKLGRVLGPIIGPVNSILRGGVRRGYRPHARWTRSRASRTARGVAPAAVAAPIVAQTQRGEPSGDEPPRAAAQRPIIQSEALWADASRDILDYVFFAKDGGVWSHGFGTIVGSMFAQPLTPPRPEQSAMADFAAQTTGAASTAMPVCGEASAADVDALVKQLRDQLGLKDDTLTGLRSALLRSDTDIMAACPYDLPAELPERLHVMKERLWGLRVALTALRGPLQIFSDGLSAEQRAKLDAGDRRRAGQCFMLTQLPQAWPTDQVARAVRPEKEQQESLGAVAETASRMAQMMMSACPQTPPETPVARLDTALKWVDTMMFAATNIVAPVDDFYSGLKSEQRSRLDTLKL